MLFILLARVSKCIILQAMVWALPFFPLLGLVETQRCGLRCDKLSSACEKLKKDYVHLRDLYSLHPTKRN
jgi:hypothetical protein